MKFAKDFRELEVYFLAKKLAFDIFLITKQFPKEEMYSLTDQIRRSSRSIGAQIAEGWSRRRYPNHFVSKLSDADAEQMETQHWIDVSLSCQYISNDTAADLLGQCSLINKMLNSMCRKADLFVRKAN
jgi:four helix bundle protein